MFGVRQKKLLILFLLILFSIVRFAYLAADPPWNLSYSAGIWTDGAHNVHAARNKILFGEWQIDAWNPTIHSPLWTYLEYVILSVIGVGFWQMNILPILLSIFSIVLFYLSFKEYFGFKYGLVILLLMGTNYMLIMFNRLALFENLMFFFMALTLFFYQRAVKQRKRVYFFLTGISTLLVFAAKNLGVYFVAAAFVALAAFFIQDVRENGWKKPFNHAALFSGGFILSLTVYLLIFYIPNFDYISKLGTHWLNQTGISSGFLSAAQRVWRPELLCGRLRFMPFTLTVGCMYFITILLSFFRKPFRIDAVELFIWLWFLAGIEFIGVLNYTPTRYYLSVMPAVISLACLGMLKFQGSSSLEKCRQWDWKFLLTIILWCLFVFLYVLPCCLPGWLTRLGSIREASRAKQAGFCFILSGVLAVLLGLTLSGLKELKYGSKIYRISKNVLFLAMIFLIVIFNGKLYRSWALRRGYAIVNSSRDIGRLLPPDSVIAGNGVMAMTVENKLKPVLAPHYFDDGTEIFYKYNVTHLFLSKYADKLGWYKKHYPEVMKYSRVIARYRIWRQNFYLFEINIPEEKKAEAYKYRAD
jgi:4-amino-4-deoxy-L-arabinose transferase-like glycosyltransferase